MQRQRQPWDDVDWAGLGYPAGMSEVEKQVLWTKWSGVDWALPGAVTLEDLGWAGKHPVEAAAYRTGEDVPEDSPFAARPAR